MYKVQVEKGIPMDKHKIQWAINMLKSTANIEHRENLDYLIKEVIKTLRQVKI